MSLSRKNKVIFPENLKEWSTSLKRSGKTIATINGSFDLLHAGHLYILDEASKQADILLVALNSDQSIQAYKSKTRPIIPLKWRLEMMAALECVDFVTFFEELDPRNLIETVVPHVHVNGKEYGESCIESATVQAVGARLHLVDRIPSLATSEIIEKIRKEPTSSQKEISCV